MRNDRPSRRPPLIIGFSVTISIGEGIMIKYPISFSAHAESASGIQTAWNLESQNISLKCSVPPEFEGPGGAFSPEDLFAQALTNCFIATFKVYAEKSRLSFGKVEARSELIVDFDDSKKPVMKSLLLKVNISGCDNTDRIKTIAQKAFDSGFILNSVKTEVKLELNVV